VERALAHAPSPASWDLHPGTIRHGFTHFVLELALARGRIDGNLATHDDPGVVWCAPGEFGRLALPTLMKKILRLAEIALP
jgi:adenine-specific DNA glycosylase